VKDREAFGRSVRAALPTEVLARWQADGVSLDESPLGKAHLDVTEDQRIEWMGAPAKLEVFLCSALDQCSEIVPAIDQAVQAAVPKQGES
jgi:hypothetical protein